MKIGSFLKDVISVGMTNGAVIIFSLISSVFTARYLGPEGNGIIAALVVYPSLFMSFGSLGIRQSTTYYLGKKIYSEEDIKQAITQIWFITTVISVVSCFILIRYFSNSGENILLVILALLPIPFTLFVTYNSGIFLGRNDIRTFNKINWIPSLITFLGILLFVVALGLHVKGAMMASVGGPVFIATILLFKNDFIKAFSLKIKWQVIKKLLSLGIVYAIALLIINLNYKIDVILIDKLSTPYELGIYGKGASLSEFLWQIPALLNAIIFARSATSKSDKKFSIKIAQLLRLSFLLVFSLSIIIYVLSEFIIIGLYGQEFFDSILVLKLLLPGVIMLIIYKVMNMDLAGKGKPWVSMWGMVPALIINIVLNYFWIPEYGANGAALASTISYGVAGVLFLFAYSATTGLSVKEIIFFKKSDFEPIFNILKQIKSLVIK